MEKKKFKFKIRFKTLILTTTLAIVLAAIAMVFFSIVIHNNNNRYYKNAATDLSNTVAATIDVEKTKNVTNDIIGLYNASETKPTREDEGTDEYNTYMAQFEAVKQSQDYKDIQAFLHEISKANIDTEGIYLGYVDYDNKLCIYLVYDEENEIYPTGIIDPLYEEDYPLVDNHKLGFVASIYKPDNENITLVTAGAPVIDKNDPDNVICYALVDISMTLVRAREMGSIIRLLVYLIAMVLIVSVAGVLYVNFVLIKPLKTLLKATSSYDGENQDATHEVFSKLDIKTTDEIGDLAESMKKMEADINRKINELTALNAELVESQRVAHEMSELANKDGLTGVRNKIAYNEEVKRINTIIASKEPIAFGIAMVDLNDLKKINDETGHNNGDVALLKLTNIICAIFAHSPVFRIGGDEFVVILINNDYKHARRLILEFNLRIEELQEDDYLKTYEKVSAAIGYAKYMPDTDTCVEDVFARADEKMYEHKREMKKK